VADQEKVARGEWKRENKIGSPKTGQWNMNKQAPNIQISITFEVLKNIQK
jgi:hypothetical protein